MQLGGWINWTLSTDSTLASLVTHYSVYLARDSGGAEKSRVGADVPYGATQIPLPADTALASFSHIVVYLKSALAEQTVPQAIAINDPWHCLAYCRFLYDG